MNKYIPVIGLEIHLELKTNSKMFCGCFAKYFGKEPNTNTCPVCLGLPGALPVPNKKAVQWCLMLGMALNCRIPLESKFDRKNYFYPDLPKGYQISQYDQPFCVAGSLALDSKLIKIRRVHLEEDTGKLIHQQVAGKEVTLIDFNRGGVPLIEIVTEPDITGSEQAKAFLQKLHQLIRYLDISDADMEKGTMRLEPNISLLPRRSIGEGGLPTTLPPYKVEVKNINSFNFVKKAIDYEIERQIGILDRGETPPQETRGWDEKAGKTYSQRSKEEAHDYRYFPEPDIPPFVWTEEYLKNLKLQLPELPREKEARFRKSYNLKQQDLNTFLHDGKKAHYFEMAVDIVRQRKEKGIEPQELANWIINNRIDIAKENPQALITQILVKRQQSEIPADTLTTAITKVLEVNKKGVEDYKKGKQNVLMFLVGQVLRETKGKGNPEEIKNLLVKKIN